MWVILMFLTLGEGNKHLFNAYYVSGLLLSSLHLLPNAAVANLLDLMDLRLATTELMCQYL